jgi:hypothetical protein
MSTAEGSVNADHAAIPPSHPARINPMAKQTWLLEWLCNNCANATVSPKQTLSHYLRRTTSSSWK